MRYSYPLETFQEVPGEISLSISISGCPLRCKGCHSTETYPVDFGKELTFSEIDNLLKKYKHSSCILFYGGEWEPSSLIKFANYIKSKKLKVALYSGYNLSFFSDSFIENFDFIKTGNYQEKLGGLNSNTTNQKFYKVHLKNNILFNLEEIKLY
ncbi:4Fe-4S cluster-binding domain-containing protein [bacterium]|jgi:anaerobic ribonucleoside-triphosphate reductase activating protein|nr:4Fe-4S cluster-binding domain-containing protein [bacterium]